MTTLLILSAFAVAAVLAVRAVRHGLGDVSVPETGAGTWNGRAPAVEWGDAA